MATSRYLGAALLAAALIPASSAAQSTGPTTGESSAEMSPRAEATLVVRNQNWLDMNVYMVRAGTRVSLGMVTSMQERTFVIPDAILGGGANGARILADPIGSRRGWSSDEVAYYAGDRLEVTLQNHLALSFLSFASNADLP